MMKCRSGSNCSSFTPTTNVASASAEGAEITTRVAPASRWADALSRLVDLPVDSMTTSTPSSFQGRAFGSDSPSIGIRWVPTTMEPPPTRTTSGKRPCKEGVHQVILPYARRICLGPAGYVDGLGSLERVVPVTEVVGRLGRTLSGGPTCIELIVAS